MESAPSIPRLTYSFARAHGVMTDDMADGGAAILRRADTSLDALIEARRIAGRPLPVVELSPQDFEARLSQSYAQGDLSETAASVMDAPEDLVSLAETLPQTSDLLDSTDDAPVIRLINGILQEAIRTRASDIHIEPYEDSLVVRFRIDGSLRDMLSLSPRLSSALVSRVKVMSRLDIAKKRVPQDGRFSLGLGQRTVDVRVSTLPAQYGERVVMRILEKTAELLDLGELGMDAATLEAFRGALAQPSGIVLVTGPTGSGKTTTLYAAVSGLATGEPNIMTVEDPIEYALPGISQTQVNPKVGMDFAAGLRAIMRQDPNIIMVGEIRDPETASVAVQAALTSHLVLSTVHTNSAIAAVTRMRDLGVEPFLLSSTVNAVVAQRLVRKLCPTCKVAYTPTPKQREDMGLSGRRTFYRPPEGRTDCPTCLGIGYKGRMGLYEIVVMDDALREMIHTGAREATMADHAFRNRQTLLQSGAAAAAVGTTSVEEVMRVVRTDG